MSWVPTLRIARAAWKGSKDPAGLIKAQLSADEPRPAGEPVNPAGPAPAAAIFRPPPEPAAEPDHSTEEETIHSQLVLLLR